MGRKKVFEEIELKISLNLIKQRTSQIRDDKHTEQNKHKEARGTSNSKCWKTKVKKDFESSTRKIIH